MSRPAKVHIDVNAFLHNLAVAKAYAGGAVVMSVVKANAYGHGIHNLLPALRQTEAIGVSCLEEALELRELGCKQPIMLMEGFFYADELELIAKHDLQMVVHQPQQIEMLKKNVLTKPVYAWLKINTGMNRIGFAPEQVSKLIETLQNLESIQKPIGLMTHFSDADVLENPKTLKQLNNFTAVAGNHKGLKTAANSAALMSYSESHFDWVRPGIMLYGISPFEDKLGIDFNLKPVMTLSSELIAVNQCKKDETVGYGSNWIAAEDMPIGIVAMGYGDGYPRHAKNGTPVLVNGVKVPLIGRVSMDMLAVDLRTCPKAKVGDEVVLWGENLPVEKIALMSDTIAYELLTSINPASVRLH